MDLNLVGLNHKTAPIEIREKFVFSHDMLSHVLKDLKLKTLFKQIQKQQSSQNT